MITVLAIGQEKESRWAGMGGRIWAQVYQPQGQKERKRERNGGEEEGQRESAGVRISFHARTAGQVGDDGPGVPGGRGLRREPLMRVGGFNIL